MESLKRSVPWQFLSNIHSFSKSSLYFLITLLVISIAVSNTLTRLFHSVWADVGNNWEFGYRWLLLNAGYYQSPFLFWMLSLHAVIQGVFWGYSSLLLFFDSMQFSFIHQFKVQPGKNEPIPKDKLWKAIKIALINNNITMSIFGTIAYFVVSWRGCSFDDPLPSFETFMRDMIVFLIAEELFFYYAHRLFHEIPYLYGKIHKLHHEFTAPIGLAAIYAHPIEHILANLFPVTVGPLIMGSHVAVLFAWSAIGMLSAVHSHSGYHFPLLPSPEAHDYHHLKFNVCYGVLGIMDYIHGTDIAFRSSSQFIRHRTFFSTESWIHVNKQLKEQAEKQTEQLVKPSIADNPLTETDHGLSANQSVANQLKID